MTQTREEIRVSRWIVDRNRAQHQPRYAVVQSLGHRTTDRTEPDNGYSQGLFVRV
jgi:hypothetical protein